MAIHEYDHIVGRERIKPRYVWAALAFAAGMLIGIALAHLG